jgi:hypothetical protein
MSTAQSANALAKMTSGPTSQTLYGIKARAIDHMVSHMSLLTGVGDLSMEGDVIIGVRFVNGALHVKFNQLSAPSQAIVVAKLTATVESALSVGSSISQPKLIESFLSSTPDSVMSKSHHHLAGALYE